MTIVQNVAPTHRCERCAIRHKAVCGALSDEELANISNIARQRFINAGQTIFSDEDHTEFFANIVAGTVKLSKTLADGRQQIVGLQFSPDFLGRAYGKENPFFAEAATDVELCCFPRDRFERLLKDYPSLEHRLFEHALGELDAAREWMLLLGRKSAEEKVASFLLMIAKRVPNIGCKHSDELNFVQFELPLTRADIADYLGLTIETVSRQFTRLRTQGVIEIANKREISVPDIDALEDRADQDSSPLI